MTHRHQLVGLCGLLALHFYVFNIVDKKFSKQVWDVYKKVKESYLYCCFKCACFGYFQLPAVYLVGDLIWFPNQFMWYVIPYFRKILDRKSVQAIEVARETYFNTLTQNIIK